MQKKKMAPIIEANIASVKGFVSCLNRARERLLCGLNNNSCVVPVFSRALYNSQ
jgi:hypothetical protein